jgi:CRISPR-associated protein Cmr5
MQTLQQERAQYALKAVQAKANTLKPNEQSEYKSYAAALPAMIHMNGLGQAAAFFKSKGGRHDDLYQLLSTWLCQSRQPFQGYQDMLEGITQNDMQTYRLAQAEAQALMDWVKKFAKAYMQGDQEGKQKESSV